MAKMIVGGEQVGARGGDVMEIRNPATGEVVDTVPRADAQDVRVAVEVANDAFRAWSQTTPHKRAQILSKAAHLVQEHLQEIAVIETKEQGKTVRESQLELARFVENLEFYAGLAPTLRGEYVPLSEREKYGMVVKRPVGVCAAIVPWNFPITLMGSKIAPALIAGNTVVVKPASTTPLAAIRLIELCNEAGLPPGVLNIITGPGGVAGEELLVNPLVRKIAFTGETVTGKHVMEAAAQTIKRVTLELGGSDPMIVCDDADLDAAASAASVGRFFNCGQACLAVKRLYVFDSAYDEFMGKFLPRVQRLKVGNGLDKDTRTGPMHTAKQREEVEEMVADAVGRGGKVVAGGQRPEGAEYANGNFYLPTVLENVPRDALMVREECFGPALPVFRVRDLDDAIEQANSSKYGLGSSIWTRDIGKATEAAERIEAGYTWVNNLHVAYDEMPFGGFKESGYGKEHGVEALDYYVEKKSIVMATTPVPAASAAKKGE
jgi:succinate-semialdehyde dehydrogenase/glutarate-semialdehyde dehydrogenase